ncbi:MAG: GIY-YIG nuclease family protein [Candidatus Levyibacteriota bacterium]
MAFFVYIVECADKTYYIGSTNNIEKRILQHNTKKSGAKYTKGRRPVTLRFFEKHETLHQARVRENQLKKLTRNEKNNLITISQTFIL